MLPFLTIGPIRIPLYGLCIALGIALGLVFCFRRLKARGEGGRAFATLLLYAALFGVLGAKLLYVLLSPPAPGVPLAERIFSGFVFYGGILGACLGLFLAKRDSGASPLAYANLGLPALPLAQAFGRIGCFFAGCCHGFYVREPFGIAFREAIGAPNGVPLFPVQLIEAAFDLGLFLTLWLFSKKPRKLGSALAIYLIAYPSLRFALEFLRGDAARGLVFGLSISQWISIPLLCWGLLLAAPRKRRDARLLA
ncbi:MAG: prolipoprotein diacylglyceryl transferase [Christensenellaceae bacterium]|jgi:phosphatidylglycerol:prolipoprotein diacylglycerol transferase|nr:prolipoprotein diacylglyceryl transferase [Christensenellaceae bacterium]